MRFFILHADVDKAAAEDLREYLRTRGPMPELDDGSRTRFLQPSDVLIALWSSKSVFSPYRMQMERRMLDAWADQQLVLVKLDHGFLPVGLRDLPSVDAGFEQTRRLSVWPQVERLAKAAMNAALLARQKAQDVAAPGAPNSGANGGAPDGSPVTDEGEREAQPQKKASRGLLGGLFWDKKKQAAAAGDAAVRKIDDLQAGAETAEPEASFLFVSYARADNDKVEPVVRAVEASGRTVWIDSGGSGGGIQAGDGWAGEIVRGIKGAKSVMVMCSPKAFQSDHIKREVYLADRYKKPMLPVFIEEAAPPEDFEYFFASVQWLELFKLPEAERGRAVTRALAKV